MEVALFSKAQFTSHSAAPPPPTLSAHTQASKVTRMFTAQQRTKCVLCLKETVENIFTLALIDIDSLSSNIITSLFRERQGSGVTHQSDANHHHLHHLDEPSSVEEKHLIPPPVLAQSLKPENHGRSPDLCSTELSSHQEKDCKSVC